ncbi:MAG: SPOR domain-containing protein, partial [Pseudomonadota bacterium]
ETEELKENLSPYAEKEVAIAVPETDIGQFSLPPNLKAALPAFDADDNTAATSAAPSGEEPDALEAAVAAIMAKETSTATASPDSVPRLDSSGLPLSYVVRLGSFGEKANADALVTKLLAADYKAYSRAVTNANGTLTAVYVGPVLTRAEANTMVTRLANGFDLNGVVETFSAQAAQ